MHTVKSRLNQTIILNTSDGSIVYIAPLATMSLTTSQFTSAHTKELIRTKSLIVIEPARSKIVEEPKENNDQTADVSQPETADSTEPTPSESSEKDTEKSQTKKKSKKKNAKK